MFVVAMYGWQSETPELAQAVAGPLGIMPFEARQRLVGGGPSVVATFAEERPARELAEKLDRTGVRTLVVDATALRMRMGVTVVRRFEFHHRDLKIASHTGGEESLPYEDMELILTGTSVVSFSDTKTVVEKKFSLGKTLLSGGIPMTKKVERQEEVFTEESEQVLYLYSHGRPTAIFTLNGLSYDGFGAEMKMSRNLNFAHLVSQLRRHATTASFDDRLLTRNTQVRLLGPAQGREAGLDLAAEILARSLLATRGKVLRD